MTKKQKRTRNNIFKVLIIIFLIGSVVYAYYEKYFIFNFNKSYAIDAIPEYDGNNYVIINNNEPDFSQDIITNESYEFYSALDYLGRTGAAEASIGIDLMPTEKRESIGSIKPTGWHTVKYDIVDGKYLYNRCHLIGFQLTGENANPRNYVYEKYEHSWDVRI